MKGFTIEDIFVGQTAEMSKTVSETDVYLFAGITGDFNPAHINDQYAKTTPFETRIAHGILSLGFVSTILGMKLPGPGTIYMGQTVKFLAPVRIGDTITAIGTVKEVIKEKNRVIITTSCVNQDGKEVLTGEATVLAPK